MYLLMYVYDYISQYSVEPTDATTVRFRAKRGHLTMFEGLARQPTCHAAANQLILSGREFVRINENYYKPESY